MPDRPIPGDVSVEVRREPDGSYTPFCRACEWEGKARQVHHVAAAICRNHITGRNHRRNYIGWEKRVRL